jgi:uncharacterized protein
MRPRIYRGAVALAFLLLASACDEKTETSVGQAPAKDIVALVATHTIEAKITGSNISSVTVSLRPVAPVSEMAPVRVAISAGTFFTSADQSEQNMIATKNVVVALTNNEWVDTSIAAACANRSLRIPDSNDAFDLRRMPENTEFARAVGALARASASDAIAQAAVWIISDDASYADLAELVVAPTLDRAGGGRVINESDTARALQILYLAGINIKSKRIWGDADLIAENATDSTTKYWLFNLLDPGQQLIVASDIGAIATVKALVARRADLNATDFEGMTALMRASENGHMDVVDALLANGADVNASCRDSKADLGHVKCQDEDGGETALMQAASAGHLGVVETLLAKGADVNASEDGTTALMVAARAGHLDIVRSLVARGADVNFYRSNEALGSALMEAAAGGSLNVVQFLLDKGARVNAGADEGPSTAISAALEYKHNDVVDLLRKNGARE